MNYHYVDEGNGEPLLMLHGNPTWSFYYRRLIAAFSPSHRAIVPDHLGCGLSDKPTSRQYDFRLESRVEDVEFLVDQLDIKEKITLVLHDWGGMIGLAYAVKYPDRIGRIILTNTAGFFPPGKKKIPLRLRMIRNLAWLATPAVLGFNLFSFSALWMAPKKRLPKLVRNGLTAPYHRPRHRLATLKFVQDIPLFPGDPGYAIVENVSKKLNLFAAVPVLILWGMHDFVFDPDYLAEWKRHWPHAQIHAFDDAGHYLLEDVPEKVIPLIRDFLKRHPL